MGTMKGSTRLATGQDFVAKEGYSWNQVWPIWPWNDWTGKFCNVSYLGQGVTHPISTNWGLTKMATALQMTFWNVFPYMKIIVFWLKFHKKNVSKDLMLNRSALVQFMAWPQTGDKPLSEPMMTKMHNSISMVLCKTALYLVHQQRRWYSLVLSHQYVVTKPQWINLEQDGAQVGMKHDNSYSWLYFPFHEDY